MTTRSAAEKADTIWANVLEDTSPGGWYGPLELPGLFTGASLPGTLGSNGFSFNFCPKQR